MTFDVEETSMEGGRPVELYTINVGALSFRYTSAEDGYTLGSDFFQEAAISRGAIALTQEDRQGVLTITGPGDLEFPQLYIMIVPSQRATLTIQRVHRDDVDQEPVVLFKGAVQAVSYSSDGLKCSITVSSILRGMSRTMPRYTEQALCNHFLYDNLCQKAQADFKFTAAPTLVSGAEITVPGISAMGDGWADAGMVVLGSSDFRLVLQHVGDVLKLILPFPTDVLGVSVDVFAGCAHDIVTCGAKFSNVLRYGGNAFIPDKKIFETGIA